jgi:hypothetical protein
MMCNPGVKENNDSRFQGAWTGTMSMFEAYRAQGGLIGFAPDPRSAHECADSRYLAIPFFDACLAQRLPDKETPGQPLKPMDAKRSWLAPLLGDKPVAAADFEGEIDKSVWLPDAAVAKAWAEYVQTGAVGDTSPPPAPLDVQVAFGSGAAELKWDAEADFESGIQAFIIQRNGRDIAQVPEKPMGRFGRPLFQRMSYHDTPEAPVPEMRYIDSTLKPGETPEYQVLTVNSVGQRSAPGKGRAKPAEKAKGE